MYRDPAAGVNGAAYGAALRAMHALALAAAGGKEDAQGCMDGPRGRWNPTCMLKWLHRAERCAGYSSPVAVARGFLNDPPGGPWGRLEKSCSWLDTSTPSSPRKPLAMAFCHGFPYTLPQSHPSRMCHGTCLSERSIPTPSGASNAQALRDVSPFKRCHVQNQVWGILRCVRATPGFQCCCPNFPSENKAQRSSSAVRSSPRDPSAPCHCLGGRLRRPRGSSPAVRAGVRACLGHANPPTFANSRKGIRVLCGSWRQEIGTPFKRVP